MTLFDNAFGDDNVTEYKISDRLTCKMDPCYFELTSVYPDTLTLVFVYTNDDYVCRMHHFFHLSQKDDKFLVTTDKMCEKLSTFIDKLLLKENHNFTHTHCTDAYHREYFEIKDNNLLLGTDDMEFQIKLTKEVVFDFTKMLMHVLKMLKLKSQQKIDE